MTPDVDHPSTADLEAALPDLRRCPKDTGALVLIVRRPAVNQRETLEEARLDPDDGLVGDAWRSRARSADGDVERDSQLTIMNARAAALIAGDPDRRALAGDQLYLDLDLSAANLPSGTRLAIGSAVIEITAVPHTGCGKFRKRFGAEALKFVNSPQGRALNLRGIYAKVVQGGTVRVGDVARKV